jgi:hypothetical protein
MQRLHHKLLRGFNNGRSLANAAPLMHRNSSRVTSSVPDVAEAEYSRRLESQRSWQRS